MFNCRGGINCSTYESMFGLNPENVSEVLELDAFNDSKLITEVL